MIQLSSSNASLLQQQGISLADAAMAAFTMASKSVSGNANFTNASTVAAASGTFTYQLAPSTIEVPLTPGGTVDCPTWATWLLGNDTAAPVSYAVQPLENLFTRFELWPGYGPAGACPTVPCFTEDDLVLLNKLVGFYLADCRYGECPTVSAECNPGCVSDGHERPPACVPRCAVLGLRFRPRHRP